MKRLLDRLEREPKLLSIYATAGYPHYNDTLTVLKTLEQSGVDLIEIGMPFSDPLADGPTIQESSSRSLANGMTTERLFQQLEGIRREINIPLILMGYFNPVFQFEIGRAHV